MMFMKVVMVMIEVVCSFLLVAVILLQRTKSQGLGGMAFGASVGESMFGSRAGNVLTKATIILSTVFLLNTLFLALNYAHTQAGAAQTKSVMERRSLMPTAPQPSRGTALPGGAPVATPVSMPTAPVSAPAATPTPAAAPTATPAAK